MSWLPMIPPGRCSGCRPALVCGPASCIRPRRTARRRNSLPRAQATPPMPPSASTEPSRETIVWIEIGFMGLQPQIDHAAHDHVADEHPDPQAREAPLHDRLVDHVAIEVRGRDDDEA